MDKRHISSLDGLRGFAALIVFVSHYSNETNMFGGVLGWGGGQLGVMLFFALAGFLMSYLHLDKIADSSAIGQYALRRVARIYPLFIIVAALPMTLLAIGYPAKVAMSDVNNFHLYFRQIFFIDRGSNVFWTIQVEVFFYVCFVGFWIMRSRGLRERHLAALLMILGILIPTTNYDDNYQLIKHAHLFMFGMLLYLACKHIKINPSPKWTTLAGMVSIAGIVLSFPKISLILFGIDLDPWNSLLPVIPVMTLMFCTITNQGLIRRIFSCPPARFMGKISYSMYLLHYFILMWVVSYTDPSENYLANFTGTFAATLLLSWASNQWIEAPLQKIVLSLPRLISNKYKLTERPL